MHSFLQQASTLQMSEEIELASEASQQLDDLHKKEWYCEGL